MILKPPRFTIKSVPAFRRILRKYEGTCRTWNIKRYCLTRNGWFWNSCNVRLSGPPRGCAECSCAARVLKDILKLVRESTRLLCRHEVLIPGVGSSYDLAVRKAKEAARIASYRTDARNPIMLFPYWAKALADFAGAPLPEPEVHAES